MKELTEIKSNDGSSTIDDLLKELENESLPEDSDKSKKTDEQIDEEYLNDMEHAYSKQSDIPKGKEKYYGI